MLTEKKANKKRSFAGLDLTIEVEKGQYRTGKDHSGKEWRNKMHAHYGYILRTNSPDGEHLDCFLKSTPSLSAPVFVVHLLRRDNRNYDEDKVFLGFSKKSDVEAMFKLHYPWSIWGGCTEFSMEHFKVIAYASSKSKTMITDQKTYDKFKKNGKLPAGVRSPVAMALKVSEGAYYVGDKHTKEPVFDRKFSSLNEAHYFYNNLVIKEPFGIIREGSAMTPRMLTEGIKKGDLSNIMLPLLSVDEYVAKDESNNIVMAVFIRNEPDAVEPVMRFFEMLPGVEVVDAGDSSMMVNTTVVYIEMKRVPESRECFEDVIRDFLLISGLKPEEVVVTLPNTDVRFRLNSNFVDVYFEKAVV